MNWFVIINVKNEKTNNKGRVSFGLGFLKGFVILQPAGGGGVEEEGGGICGPLSHA